MTVQTSFKCASCHLMLRNNKSVVKISIHPMGYVLAHEEVYTCSVFCTQQHVAVLLANNETITLSNHLWPNVS